MYRIIAILVGVSDNSMSDSIDFEESFRKRKFVKRFAGFRRFLMVYRKFLLKISTFLTVHL